MLDNGLTMHKWIKLKSKQKTHDEVPVAEETTCIRRDCWTIAFEALLTVMMESIYLCRLNRCKCNASGGQVLKSSVVSIVLCIVIVLLCSQCSRYGMFGVEGECICSIFWKRVMLGEEHVFLIPTLIFYVALVVHDISTYLQFLTSTLSSSSHFSMVCTILSTYVTLGVEPKRPLYGCQLALLKP